MAQVVADNNVTVTPNFSVETLRVLVDSMNDKFRLMLDEAEKRNGQRFDAQQEAVATAMVAQEKAVLAAMAAAEKAVTKAEIASEKRFESVNEFRKTLSDQTASFMTRNEYIPQHDSLLQKVQGIEKRLDEMQSRGTGRNDIWYVTAMVVTILVAVGAVVVHLVK